MTGYFTNFIVAEIALASVIGLAFLVRLWFREVENFKGKHVLITGGSEGIGRALALEFLRHGAKVTITARTESKLKTACTELAKESNNDAIAYEPMDVTDYQQVTKGLEAAASNFGPVNVVVTCAGIVQPGYYLEQDVSVFANTMNINYMGSVNVAKAITSSMIMNHGGHMVFVSSPAAGASILGYCTYSPTKAAVMAFANALRHELKGFGIKVHCAFPPDTDTPGFEEENKTKPKENLLIQPPEVFSAESVALAIVAGMRRGEYYLGSPDVGATLLMGSLLGINPRGRWAVLEVMLSPLIHIACMLYGWNGDRIAAEYGRRKKKELVQQSESKKSK